MSRVLQPRMRTLISKTDAHFVTLSSYDKIIYLLNLGNDNTCKLVGKDGHLMFQKRKEIIKRNIIKGFKFSHLALIVSLY